jgi:hypothetical protein
MVLKDLMEEAITIEMQSKTEKLKYSNSLQSESITRFDVKRRRKK